MVEYLYGFRPRKSTFCQEGKKCNFVRSLSSRVLLSRFPAATCPRPRRPLHGFTPLEKEVGMRASSGLSGMVFNIGTYAVPGGHSPVQFSADQSPVFYVRSIDGDPEDTITIYKMTEDKDRRLLKSNQTSAVSFTTVKMGSDLFKVLPNNLQAGEYGLSFNKLRSSVLYMFSIVDSSAQ